MSTLQQLKERWETPEGKKVRQKIIDNCRSNWERYLINFPYTSEVLNNRDLRYINFYNEEFKKARKKFKKVRKKNIEFFEVKGPDFSKSDLTGADFFLANLNESSFKGSIINNVNLMHSMIMMSNFRNSIINDTKFVGANLWNSNFSVSNIQNSDFSGSNLLNIDLSSAQIINCKIYGISCWDLKRNNFTIIKDLIINRQNKNKEIITTDDIELAQFIYLILNNNKISNLITTMRTKAILILGSFDNESKPVLDKIKEILPKYNLIPIVFDFSAPLEQRSIETIRTLALLSKFVIVDLSVRSGQYLEISIVSDTVVPFATIAFEDTIVSEMLRGFNVYDWWRGDYFSYPKVGWENRLPDLVEKEIIPWAEEINNKLLKNRKRNND